MAVQQDGMVVTVDQGETTRSFTVVNVGGGGFQQVLLQRHGETLKVTLTKPRRSFVASSGCSLRSFYRPGTQHSL